MNAVQCELSIYVGERLIMDAPELDTLTAYVCDVCDADTDDCTCVTCERCDDTVSEWDITSVSLGYRLSEIWCDHCAASYAFSCDSCGESHSTDNMYSCDCCDRAMCESCREDTYYCDNCDRSYCGEYGCEDCPEGSDLIGEYHSGPDCGIRFHGEGTWFMGVELEMSAPVDAASVISDALNADHHDTVWFERDGSVYDGFEAIFQPRTLASWREMNWDWTLAAYDAGARPGGHGFHVHISRAAFKSGNALRRFADLLNGRSGSDARDFIESLAGRSANSWAKFTNDDRRAIAKHAPRGRFYGDRYSVVNLSTGYRPTVEIRLGASTLSPSKILAWLETIAACVELANALDLTTEVWGGLDTPTAILTLTEGRPEYVNAYRVASAWFIARDYARAA